LAENGEIQVGKSRKALVAQKDRVGRNRKGQAGFRAASSRMCPKSITIRPGKKKNFTICEILFPSKIPDYAILSAVFTSHPWKTTTGPEEKLDQDLIR
jgi:hypothetical protein